MGMFDYVWMECPECAELYEGQSKAGKCTLADYKIASNWDKVPPEVGADMLESNYRCEKCKAVFHVEMVQKPQFVTARGAYDGWGKTPSWEED